MLIDASGFSFEPGFPAILSPSRRRTSYDTFIKTTEKNHDSIQKALLHYGALLFRGFPVSNATQFSSFIEALRLGQFVNYIGGDSPRDKVDKTIYTSTEAPRAITIPLHQELSFIKSFPKHIYFYCETPPVSGGETIIADARRIYGALNKKIVRQFNEKGLTYIARYYYKSHMMAFLNRFQRFHKSWTEVFETHNKLEVEKKCINNDFSWSWLPNDWIEVKQTRPALHTHPETQETVWFNQAHLYDFNPRLLGVSRYVLSKLLYFQKTTRLHEIVFSDNAPIPRKDLYHILDTLKEQTIAFPWQKGDVLVLDNILAMHGRASFKGDRRILTALTS